MERHQFTAQHNSVLYPHLLAGQLGNAGTTMALVCFGWHYLGSECFWACAGVSRTRLRSLARAGLGLGWVELFGSEWVWVVGALYVGFDFEMLNLNY